MARGLDNPRGLAFGPKGELYVSEAGRGGSLYALEIARDGLLAAEKNGGAGALMRIAPDGTRTTVLSKGLVTPSGLAMGHDGKLYVSNYGVFAGQGQVIRLDR